MNYPTKHIEHKSAQKLEENVQLHMETQTHM